MKKRAGDLFYFDEVAWETLVATAVMHGQRRPQSRDHVTKKLQGKRRASQRRQRLATVLNRAEQRQHSPMNRAGTNSPLLRDRVLMAMRPGQWLGAIDIATLVYGAAPASDLRRRVRMVLVTALAHGKLVRWAPNEDYRRSVHNLEPAKLWSLTTRGAAERARLLEGYRPNRTLRRDSIGRFLPHTGAR